MEKMEYARIWLVTCRTFHKYAYFRILIHIQYSKEKNFPNNWQEKPSSDNLCTHYTYADILHKSKIVPWWSLKVFMSVCWKNA